MCVHAVKAYRNLNPVGKPNQNDQVIASTATGNTKFSAVQSRPKSIRIIAHAGLAACKMRLLRVHPKDLRDVQEQQIEMLHQDLADNKRHTKGADVGGLPHLRYAQSVWPTA